MWQAPSLGSSRVMLGTELPPEHGVGKKNKITARVRGPVIHTETGSQRGGGGCSPILESERGHVGLFVPLKLSTLLDRQKGRKKRPRFGILTTTLMGQFLGHPTPACFSVGGLHLSRVVCISVQWR